MTTSCGRWLRADNARKQASCPDPAALYRRGRHADSRSVLFSWCWCSSWRCRPLPCSSTSRGCAWRGGMVVSGTRPAPRTHYRTPRMDSLDQAAIFLLTAVLLVPVFQRFKLGAVLGYLVAGMLIGPWGLRIVADAESTLRLAEFGV